MDLSYRNMVGNPLRKASLQLRSEEQRRQFEVMVTRMRGAVPDWSEDTFVMTDKIALHFGKRCILWDDEGAGFCVWLRWDWARNKPATPSGELGTSNEPGWYQQLKPLFKAPLLDVSVADEMLAMWLDTNTMRCHKNLLPLLPKIRTHDAGAADGHQAGEADDVPKFVLLDDEYQGKLDSTVLGVAPWNDK